MNRTPFVAAVALSIGAWLVILTGRAPLHPVFAGSGRGVESQPLSSGQQSQPAPSGSLKVVVPPSGKTMTPIELLQLQAAGLQDEVNSLQAQLKGDEGTIRALQSSLQTLQTTFANHSHKVVIEIPGHLCTGLDTFIVTDAATGNPRRVSLQFAQACTNPKWDGATPNSFESLSVSTPIQGAQPPQ